MLALRWHWATTGQPARTLLELPDELLASLPVDPVAGSLFTYQVSQGEEVELWIGGPPRRKVPAGQWILSGNGRNFIVPSPME